MKTVSFCSSLWQTLFEHCPLIQIFVRFGRKTKINLLVKLKDINIWTSWTIWCSVFFPLFSPPFFPFHFSFFLSFFFVFVTRPTYIWFHSIIIRSRLTTLHFFTFPDKLTPYYHLTKTIINWPVFFFRTNTNKSVTITSDYLTPDNNR